MSKEDGKIQWIFGLGAACVCLIVFMICLLFDMDKLPSWENKEKNIIKWEGELYELKPVEKKYEKKTVKTPARPICAEPHIKSVK